MACVDVFMFKTKLTISCVGCSYHFSCIGQVVLGSKHADFVEMKVHGMEARVNKRELKPGTQIKKFLMTNSDLCPNRITMTRWSLEDRYVTFICQRFDF